MLSEGSEEYLQEILQPVFRNLAFDENNELKLVSEDAAYAGLIGALTGGIFESGNIVGDAVKPPETSERRIISQPTRGLILGCVDTWGYL